MSRAGTIRVPGMTRAIANHRSAALTPAETDSCLNELGGMRDGAD